MEQCQGHSQRSLTLCIGHLTFRRLPRSRGLITKGVFKAGREFLIMVALYPQTFSEPQPSLPALHHHSPHLSLKCDFLRLCFRAQGSRDRREIFAPSGLGGKKQVHSSEDRFQTSLSANWKPCVSTKIVYSMF